MAKPKPVEEELDLTRVWKKDPKERTKGDVELLAQTFSNNKFFLEKR